MDQYMKSQNTKLKTRNEELVAKVVGIKEQVGRWRIHVAYMKIWARRFKRQLGKVQGERLWINTQIHK